MDQHTPLLRIELYLYHNFGLIRINERIWIMFLERKFQLIFFHEDLHEDYWKEKGSWLSTNDILKIEERKKKKLKHENLFWILFLN